MTYLFTQHWLEFLYSLDLWIVILCMLTFDSHKEMINSKVRRYNAFSDINQAMKTTDYTLNHKELSSINQLNVWFHIIVLWWVCSSKSTKDAIHAVYKVWFVRAISHWLLQWSNQNELTLHENFSLRFLQNNCARCSSNVIVEKSQLNCFRQHCERCSCFNEQLRDLSKKDAIISHELEVFSSPCTFRSRAHFILD